MPAIEPVELNGFSFTLTTLLGSPGVSLDLSDEKIAVALQERDPKLLAALQKLAEDAGEIDSVLLASESFSMWLQSRYSNNKQQELHRILHSEYASDALKQRVRQELGYITPPTRQVSASEWYAMMYGVYQAMPEEEKRALRRWEEEYVDGSGKFGTSDWPGWAKYIGKFPSSTSKSQVSKKPGFIYLVRADTGEYKIGYSGNVEQRVKAFSVQPPFEYELVHTIPVDDMIRAEALVHERFAHKRIRGEWFALNEEEVEQIVQLASFKNDQFSAT